MVVIMDTIIIDINILSKFIIIFIDVIISIGILPLFFATDILMLIVFYIVRL